MRIYQHICVKMKQCVFLNDTETLPAGPPQYLLIRLLYWLQGNKQKESFHRTLHCHVKRSKYTTGIKMVNIIKVLLTKYISLSLSTFIKAEALAVGWSGATSLTIFQVNSPQSPTVQFSKKLQKKPKTNRTTTTKKFQFSLHLNEPQHFCNNVLLTYQHTTSYHL